MAVVLADGVERVVTSGIFSLDGDDFEVDNNVWLVGDDAEVLVIDAAHDHEPILAAIGGRKVVAIVATHGHNDHINAGPALAAATGAPILLHPADAELWGQAHPTVRWDRDLVDGERLSAGGHELVVLHTPGHTPGGVCLWDEAAEVVFSADTLFCGGPGATGRSFSSFPDIIESIRTRLLTLPAHTAVHTGHGDSTTIGAEAPHLDEWIARGCRLIPMLPPILVDDVRPRTPSGLAAKGVIGQELPVSAVLVADGHDRLGARLRWRKAGARTWTTAPLVEQDDHRWRGVVTPQAIGAHQLVVEAWTDRYATWRHEVEVKVGAGQDVALELEEGGLLLEELAARCTGHEQERLLVASAGVRRAACALDVRLDAACDDAVARIAASIPDARRSESPVHPVWVDRERAAVGAWYELFPRSFGGLRGAAKHLVEVAGLGFDVVYLPPVHPIGITNRKGRDGTLVAGPDDPGSPWAIGGPAGGHDAIHPELGTDADFDVFVARAAELGLEVALDYALQCSPDHPWVRDHPEWFTRRPDGSIRYAENPPKKYQDIHPIDFWPDAEADRVALWEACRAVLLRWVDRGIRIFRVDNPHTKPVAFWAWLIDDVHKQHPDLVFLAEAFTAPEMMAKLAEVGFSQSYTYFTWRTQPWELRDYVLELTSSPLVDVMRPAFWPNTPDILAGPLRRGPRSAFALRLVLAATLVPTYGIYSGYELCENEPAGESNEEYLHSEKYELKDRDFGAFDSLAPLLRRVNEVRRAHPGVWSLRDVRFHHSDDEHLLVYSRGHRSRGDLLLVVVNLDPHDAHETTLRLDLGALGLLPATPYQLTDELTGEHYTWTGSDAYVRLDPAAGQVAHLFSLHLNDA